ARWITLCAVLPRMAPAKSLRPREPMMMTSASCSLASARISRAACPNVVGRISPSASTPACLSASTPSLTGWAASWSDSLGTSPIWAMTSFSRRCSTHTLPFDSRASSLAAAITRGEVSEWSTATSSLSYISQPHSLADGLSRGPLLSPYDERETPADPGPFGSGFRWDRGSCPAVPRPGDPVGARQRDLGHRRGLDGQRHQVIGLEVVD